MTDSTCYCLKVFALTGLCLGLLGAFTGTIDPYQLLGSRSIQEFNAKKTEIFFQLPVTKPYQFYSSDYANLILGSSRAGRAVDPGHPAIRGEGYYNFATPGATPEIDYLKLTSAVALREVEKVIYFVDFFTFNVYYSMGAGSNEDFRRRMSRQRPVWAQPVFLLQFLSDYSASLWSYQSIRSSVLTIRNQQSADSGQQQYTELFDNGLWRFAFASDRKPMDAFNLMQLVYLRDTWFAPGSRRFSLVETEQAPNRPFHYFRSLVALAHDSGIAMDIVILPIHARLLDALDYAGLWQGFEQWKGRLVAINTDVARSRDQSPFPLWDFNGYYPAITEPVSPETRSIDLEWFYDSAHPHIDTGDRILDIIRGDSEAIFGGRIHAENIERWLADQRNLRDRYRAANPRETEAVRRGVDRFLRRHPASIEPVPALELEVDKLGTSEHTYD